MIDRLKRWLGLAAEAGARGERLAADWLVRERGFRIVARNWRSPRDRRDELDLVARDGDVLVFVEVKTRGADALVPGFHAVDARKKRVLRRAAEAYLAGLRVKPQTVRCDVVEVELPVAGAVGDAVVRHFENVELFPKHFRP
ncbi:MAG: YraN family protein [Verrucomicrobia bacterium]|nr:YraN family protein [Verrucomicrobiota bacterium]